MTPSPVKPDSFDRGVCQWTLESWEQFDKFVKDGYSEDEVHVFRGQADVGWPLISTIDRLEKRFPTRKNTGGGVPSAFRVPPACRDIHLRAFQEAARRARGPAAPDFSPEEWWAYAQQHGLATPLLDWTYSPYIALFFAMEEKECRRNDGEFGEPEQRAVFALHSAFLSNMARPATTECEAEHLNAAFATAEGFAFPTPRFVVPRTHVGFRQDSQATVFLGMPSGSSLEDFVRMKWKGFPARSDELRSTVVHKVIIPNQDRIGCLKWLNRMNINRWSLFPDEDGAAKYVNALWELDFQSPMGWLPYPAQ
ncbi:MAG: FRG domain-containing protein [Planctomycetes bacterium]|nr:FRG domain-containing protein [Planctomycetota bacterium]